MADEADYFGIPKEHFAQALRAKEGSCRTAGRVPSRKEVQCLPFQELRAILIGWMVHSPTELVPSRGQIDVVLDILVRRDDAHAMGDLHALCRNYIDGA